MTVLFDFPQNAKVGRILPKSKVYEHASPSSAVKEIFVREVDKITWLYKISTETVNIPAREGVQEIQVFNILLKTGSLKEEVLQTIDKVIPSPILHQLEYQGQIKYALAYKRPNEADSSKWVLSSYFSTDWFVQETKKVSLPLVLDLLALYEQLITNVVALPQRFGESLDDYVTRTEMLGKMKKEAEKVEIRLKREKQFNRKVDLNSKLRKIKRKMAELAR